MTFAGTPDRVESRLVPEAGFALDTFPITGLPRRPSAAQLRAAWRASAAPAHCLRILARRRPDVVLGAGGYVAGPMVLADRLRRIPAALTRPTRTSASPIGSRRRSPAGSSSRTRSPVETERRCASSAARSRARIEARAARTGVAASALCRRPGRGGLRRARRRAVARRNGRRGVELRRAGDPAHLWGARLRRAPTAGREARLRAARADRPFWRGARGRRSRRLPRRRTVWELAAAGTPSVLVPYPYATADHQTLNARHFEEGEAPSSSPTRRSAASRRSSRSCSRAPNGSV